MSAGEAFRVSYPGKVLAEVKQILREAQETGKLDQLAACLVEVDQRLRTDPFGLGELTRVLRRMKVALHVGFVRPLKVEFGIKEDSRIVFVRNIQVIADVE